MTLSEPVWRIKCDIFSCLLCKLLTIRIARPCLYYRQGNCLFGDSCNFLHTEPWSPRDATLVDTTAQPKSLVKAPKRQASGDSDSNRSQQLNELLDALKDVIGEQQEEEDPDCSPSPPSTDRSGLLSPVDVSGLRLSILRQDTPSFDSLDSGYESWHTPGPLLMSPPRSPSVASTFELLASPFRSPSSRLMSAMGRDLVPTSPFGSSLPSLTNDEGCKIDLSLDSPSDLNLVTERSSAKRLSAEEAPSHRPQSSTSRMLSSQVPKEDEIADSAGFTARWDAQETDTAVYLGTPSREEIVGALEQSESRPLQYLDEACSFSEDEMDAESSFVEQHRSPPPDDSLGDETIWEMEAETEDDSTARLPYDTSAEDDTIDSFFPHDSSMEDDTIDSFFPHEQTDDTISSLYEVYSSESDSEEDLACGTSSPVETPKTPLRERVFTPPPIQASRGSGAITAKTSVSSTPALDFASPSQATIPFTAPASFSHRERTETVDLSPTNAATSPTYRTASPALGFASPPQATTPITAPASFLHRDQTETVTFSPTNATISPTHKATSPALGFASPLQATTPFTAPASFFRREQTDTVSLSPTNTMTPSTHSAASQTLIDSTQQRPQRQPPPNLDLSSPTNVIARNETEKSSTKVPFGFRNSSAGLVRSSPYTDD